MICFEFDDLAVFNPTIDSIAVFFKLSCQSCFQCLKVTHNGNLFVLLSIFFNDLL
jgi:hypothetical protein